MFPEVVEFLEGRLPVCHQDIARQSAPHSTQCVVVITGSLGECVGMGREWGEREIEGSETSSTMKTVCPPNDGSNL